MRHEEAIALLRSAVPATGGTWADLGAGTGTFTRALASLVGPTGRVIAVDRDPAAVAQLRRTSGTGSGEAEVMAVLGDLRDLGTLTTLRERELSGVLLANVLHFYPEPAAVLRRGAALLRPGGHMVVIEYDGRAANPWVPHPVTREQLGQLAADLGLPPPSTVAERPSVYGGVMYCSLIRMEEGGP